MTFANNPPAVVMKAFTWAYEELGLTTLEAASMLGISEHGLQQTSLVGFEVESEESEIQLAFIRLYHLLYALSDGDSEQMVEWFNRPNPHLAEVPKTLCSDMTGILCTSEYLESMHSSTEAPHLSFIPTQPVEEQGRETVAR